MNEKETKYCTECKKITPGIFKCDRCSTSKPPKDWDKK